MSISCPRSLARHDITGDAFFLAQVRRQSSKEWVRPIVIPYMVRPARDVACYRPPSLQALPPACCMLHVATQVAFTVASAVSLFSVIVKLYIVFRRRQQSEAAATRRSSLGGVKIAPALARVTSAKQLKAEFDRVRMEQARYLSYLLLLFLEGLSSPHPSFLHFRPAACTSAAFVRDALQISRWVRPSHRIGSLSVFLWSRAVGA